MSADEIALELLITVVVAAEDDDRARQACRNLLSLAGGRIVTSGDCSDEEPGCRSVGISRSEPPGGRPGAALLTRTVRDFLGELGAGDSTHRVSCAPPTAWTVIDDPDLLGRLVPGGERLLVEAWLNASPAPVQQDAPRG